MKQLQLRYTPDANPGVAPKQKATGNNTKEYEKNRKLGFLLGDFSWLRFDTDANRMFCKHCTSLYGNKSSFVKCSNNFKRDALTQHSESSFAKPPAQSKAAHCLKALQKSQYDSLVIKFRTAHAIAKHNLSLRTFNVISDLDEAKGLPVGTSYRNDHAAASFLASIAEVARKETVTKLTKSQFVSFTINGSTDFTGDDMENIYITTVSLGRITDSFLHIGCANSALARDIHDHIKKVFKELMQSKLVGFTADGASNMQGQHKGLAALLRADWPHIVVTHCLAHRFELAFKDAVKMSSMIYDSAMTLLMGLYYLYRKSPKQKKALMETFSVLNFNTSIMPTWISGTRWLPHLDRSLRTFFQGYRAFVMQLESSSHDNPKAEGLAKLAADGHVITYLLDLKAVVDVLFRLPKYLHAYN
ncbi:ZN862-like protein, partial [Mya arenaria]